MPDTELAAAGSAEHPGRQKLAMFLAVLAVVPGLTLRLGGVHPEPLLAACAFGLAVIGAAFMLAWGAEAIQLDISAGLALALLALIAVLPEYAVDFVFTWKAGKDPTYAPDALANMTGGNQLLIGVGWSMVVFIAAYRIRAARKGEGPQPLPPGVDLTTTDVKLERTHSVEIAFLVLATVYGLTLPFKSSLVLVDSAVLTTIFVVYIIRVARAPAEEPHLVGPAQLIGTLAPTNRRIVVGLLFAGSVIAIVLSAEPFAESLVDVGERFNIDHFLLVQLVAPLASEAPELLVAGLFAWRLNTNSGFGALVSSKVNQWTLLVGSLPIVFAVSSGTLHGLHIDEVQRDELWVTAAQSAFAVAVLANRRISVKEASALFGLWAAQLVTKFDALMGDAQQPARIGVGVVYMVLAAIMIYRNRRAVKPLLRDGFVASYDELSVPEVVRV